MMVINLSALRIGHIYPQGNIPGKHSVIPMTHRESNTLPRAPHEFVNILFTIPSYTTQFHWKYKCVVYDGMLKKYMY